MKSNESKASALSDVDEKERLVPPMMEPPLPMSDPTMPAAHSPMMEDWEVRMEDSPLMPMGSNKSAAKAHKMSEGGEPMALPPDTKMNEGEAVQAPKQLMTVGGEPRELMTVPPDASPGKDLMDMAEGHSLQERLIAEFVGTFVLVFTIGIAVKGGSFLAPFAIGIILGIVVFQFGSVSGGIYNPAVTFAVLLTGRGKLTPRHAAAYMSSQFLAGFFAALISFAITEQTFCFHIDNFLAAPSSNLQPATAPGRDVSSVFGNNVKFAPAENVFFVAMGSQGYARCPNVSPLICDVIAVPPGLVQVDDIAVADGSLFLLQAGDDGGGISTSLVIVNSVTDAVTQSSVAIPGSLFLGVAAVSGTVVVSGGEGLIQSFAFNAAGALAAAPTATADFGRSQPDVIMANSALAYVSTDFTVAAEAALGNRYGITVASLPSLQVQNQIPLTDVLDNSNSNANFPVQLAAYQTPLGIECVLGATQSGFTVVCNPGVPAVANRFDLPNTANALSVAVGDNLAFVLTLNNAGLLTLLTFNLAGLPGSPPVGISSETVANAVHFGPVAVAASPDGARVVVARGSNGWWTTAILEIVYTMAIAGSVLHAGTSFDNPNHYFGWTIGLTVTAGAIASGGFGQGSFNPAVTVGHNIVNYFPDVSQRLGRAVGTVDTTEPDALSWFIFFYAPFVGAVIAAMIFRGTRSEEYPDGVLNFRDVFGETCIQKVMQARARINTPTTLSKQGPYVEIDPEGSQEVQDGLPRKGTSPSQ
jgi:glycerol uptake facilitator-like aquaporin